MQTGMRAQPDVAGLGETADVPKTPVLSKDTAALLEEMLPFYDRLAQQTGNRNDLQLRTAEANWRVGAIRQRLGQYPEAIKAYQNAIMLFAQLSAYDGATRTLRIAQIQNELGRLFTSQRNSAKARESHLAALNLLQPVDNASAPQALHFELARTCYFLGVPERPLPGATPKNGPNPAQASSEQREFLAKAVNLLASLTASPSANPEYQHLLALCYLEGARDDRKQERGSGDERAIRLLEQLVKSYPAVADYAYDLSEAYVRLHLPDPPLPREQAESIEDRFRKALALLEQLVAKHSDVPDFLAFQARVHHKLGSFYQQTGRWTDAERDFRKAIDCQSRLLAQFPNSPYFSLWMSTFRLALADALLRLERSTEARAELENAISTLEIQLKQNPELFSFHEMLARAYSEFEKVLRRSGEREKADEVARKAEQERNSFRPPR
jgi:tetratricopeptide (TPR) repeat protein